MIYNDIYEPSYDLAEKSRKLFAASMPGKNVDMNKILSQANSIMEGAIDVHIHGGPDAWVPRFFNEIELAIQAAELGMGAVVMKCHSGPSARSACLAQWALDKWAKEHNRKSIRVIGGVVLNYNVGGLNPEAVETSAAVGGRFVWTPNMDSAHHHKISGISGGIEVIGEDDQVVPEFHDIFEIIVKHDLVLSLTHHSTKERFILIDAAKKAGVKRIELVHPFWNINKMTIEQMKLAAEKGAYLGLYCMTLIGHTPEFSMPEVLEAINKVGAEHFVIGTDAGGWLSAPPATTFRTFLAVLLQAGVPDADVQKMARINAEKLIF